MTSPQVTEADKARRKSLLSSPATDADLLLFIFFMGILLYLAFFS